SVPGVTGRPVAGSATPATTSTTCFPSTYAATCSPRSTPDATSSSATSCTFSYRGGPRRSAGIIADDGHAAPPRRRVEHGTALGARHQRVDEVQVHAADQRGVFPRERV